VTAPKTVLKLETVSSRLKRQLQHPNRGSTMTDIQFSPDGKRLIAADYPGGVVQLWDVSNGDQLRSIETGYGYRGSMSFLFVSPDWRTIYVAQEVRKPERIEEGGKSKIRWSFGGGVRCWDLETGKWLKTFQQVPPHGIRDVTMSLNCERFVTYEELPGVSDGAPKRGGTLWDVTNGKYHAFPKGASYYSTVFSPSGRTFAGSMTDDDNYTRSIKLHDAATGVEIWSRPIQEKYARIYVTSFSPDGSLIAADVHTYDQPNKWEGGTCWLEFWDAATGKVVGSITGDAAGGFYNNRFTPDGRTLVTLTRIAEQMVVHFIDVTT
jgi:WD40 repeat protein